MPIHEIYKKEALSRLEELKHQLRPILKQAALHIDNEDLEMGVSEEVPVDQNLWKRAVEDNNYMEIVFTEIMEHHDGAYLKATFRNAIEDAHADRYVSIRSSGRVETTHAFFMNVDHVSVRVEKKPDGRFLAFFKAS